MGRFGSSIALGGVMRSPMMRIAIPFIAGIVVAMVRPVPILDAGIALIAATFVTLFLLWWRRTRSERWRHAPGVLIWFFVFGVFWQLVRDPLSRSDHVQMDGTELRYRAMRITAVNGITEKVVRTDATALGALETDGMRTRSGRVMLTLMRRPDQADPICGDLILVRSSIESITRIPDPGGFDRRSWGASRGMYHESFAGPDAWVIQGHQVQWTDLFEGVRQQVSRWLVESGLPTRERALVRALVLGLRDELEGDQRNAFVRSGTIHVLAVSGTHVGFIYAMLLFMLGWWGGSGKVRLMRGSLILLALWGYAGLTGGSPSVLRATIMFSLFTLASMSSRRADPINSLFTAALVLLVWEPHMLIEIGFQLSFLAVLGILLFHRPIERLWVPNGKWVGRIWTLTVLSLSAQLLTTPLSLYYFKAFPVWFLPANLVVVTAVGFAVYGSVGLLLVHAIPIIGPLVVVLLTWLLVIVDRVTAFFGSLPGAYPAIRIGKSDVLLLYLLVLAVATWLMLGWRRSRIIALCALGGLLLNWTYHTYTLEDHASFTVYDDRQALQAAMTLGKQYTVLCSAPDDVDDPWLGMKMERHQRALGLAQPTFAFMEEVHGSVAVQRGVTLAGAGAWLSPGISVRFMSTMDPRSIVVGGVCDVLVVHDTRYLSADELTRWVTGARQVVLAGGLSWKLREHVRQWCTDHAVPCHDIREQGAFAMERRADRYGHS